MNRSILISVVFITAFFIPQNTYSEVFTNYNSPCRTIFYSFPYNTSTPMYEHVTGWTFDAALYPVWSYTTYPTQRNSKIMYYRRAWWNGTVWTIGSTQVKNWVETAGPGILVDNSKLSDNAFLAAQYGTCDDTCFTEKQAKIAECGGNDKVDWATWNNVTCTGGECLKPCDQPGEYSFQACYDKCGGDIETYSNEQCGCVCGTCDEEWIAKTAACAPFTVNIETWNNITCTGDCNVPSCNEELDKCAKQCGSVSNIKNFTCDDSQENLIVGPCECKDPPPPPEEGTLPPEDPPIAPPNEPPVESAEPDPTDPASETGWLTAIKNILNKISDQANAVATDLQLLIRNQIKSDQKLGVIADNTAKTVDAIGDLRGDLEGLVPKTIQGKGGALLPKSNTYDSEIEEVPDDGFFDNLAQYVSSGLPLVGYINGTDLSISGSSSSLSFTVWGETISIDFSSVQDVLNKMGLLLVAISTIIGFMIITKKG